MAQWSGATDVFEDLITCKICYEQFSDPRGLPCHHTFCGACLTSYINTAEGGFARGFRCPLCREWTRIPGSGVQGFPADFKIRQLLDIQGETQGLPLISKGTSTPCDACRVQKNVETLACCHCFDCNMDLCDGCSETHLLMRVTQNHRVEAKSSIKFRCDTHGGDRVDYFCVACTSPVCYHCCVADHQRCEVVTIAPNQRRIYRVILLAKEQQRQRNQEMMQNELLEIEMAVEHFHLTVKNCKESVKALGMKRRELARRCETDDNDMNEQIGPLLATGDGVELSEIVEIVEHEIHRMLSTGLRPSLLGFIPMHRGPDRPANVACLPSGIVYGVSNTVCISLVHRDFEDCQSFSLREPGARNATDVNMISINVLANNDIVTTFWKNGFYMDHRDSMGSRIECVGPLPDFIVSGKKAMGWGTAAVLAAGILGGPLAAVIGGASAVLTSTVNQRNNSKIVDPCVVIFPTGNFKPNNAIIIAGGGSPCMYRYESFNSMPKQNPLPGLYNPQHAIMVNGLVYVTDSTDNTVKAFNNVGALCQTFGGTGTKDGQLVHPQGLCSWNNKLLVADCLNHRVSAFTENGRFVKQVLKGEDGIRYPIAIRVLKENGKLSFVVAQSSPFPNPFERQPQKMSVYRLNSLI